MLRFVRLVSTRLAAIIGAFVVTLCLYKAVSAQHRTASIVGPDKAPVGTIVELTATSDVASAMIWTTASDAPYRTYEGGRVLVFATPKPGRYEFVLITVVVTADNKPLVSHEKFQVEITGGPPGPGPGPQPPVPPDPPSPPNPPAPVDKWGLVKLSRDTAPSLPDQKQKVRSNYLQVASAIIAGVIKSVDDAKARISDLNRAAVGNPASDDNHPWNKHAFAVGERVAALKQSGEIQNTLADQAQVFADIAKGLE